MNKMNKNETEQFFVRFLKEEADGSSLAKLGVDSIERLKEMGREPNAHPVARAYAKGLDTIYATDAKEYVESMSLTEIAEEWGWDDPVDLLVVLAMADEKREKGKRLEA